MHDSVASKVVIISRQAGAKKGRCYMSEALSSFIQEVRLYVKEKLLNYVKQFDVEYWVGYVNENQRKFAWVTPYVKISAKTSEPDKAGRCVWLRKYYDDVSLSSSPLTKYEFYDEIVNLLYAKYF